MYKFHFLVHFSVAAAAEGLEGRRRVQRPFAVGRARNGRGPCSFRFLRRNSENAKVMPSSQAISTPVGVLWVRFTRLLMASARASAPQRGGAEQMSDSAGWHGECNIFPRDQAAGGEKWNLLFKRRKACRHVDGFLLRGTWTFLSRDGRSAGWMGTPAALG